MAQGNILREMFIKVGLIGDKKSTRGIKNIDKAMKRASSTASIFIGNLSAIGVAKGFQLLNLGIMKTISLTKELITEAATLAGNKEGIQASLSGFLQSDEKANKLLTDLSEFGARTPFQVTDLREYAKVLLATGFAVDEIIPSLSQLGDLTGGKKDILNRILINFAQIKTTGRASLIDLRQFAMGGIPIFSALEKTMGVSNLELEKMISNGDVGLAEVKKAFDSLTKAGGSFHRQMDRASLTFHGMISNLADAWEVAMEKMGKPIIDRLKPVIKFLGELVEKTTPAFIRFGQKVGSVFATLMRTVESLGGAKFFSGFLDGFGDFLVKAALLFEDFIFLVKGERSAIGNTLGIETGAGFGKLFLGFSKGIAGALIDGLIWATPYLLTFAKDMGQALGEALKDGVKALVTTENAKKAGASLFKSFFVVSESQKNDRRRMIDQVRRSKGGDLHMSEKEVASFGDGRGAIQIKMDNHFNGVRGSEAKIISSQIESVVSEKQAAARGF